MVRGVPLISVSKAKIFQRNNWDLCSFTPTCVDSSSDDSELSRINNFFGGDKDNCHVLTWQPSYEKKKLWRRLLHAALSSWCRFSLVSKVCLTLWYRTSVECQPCGYWKKKTGKAYHFRFKINGQRVMYLWFRVGYVHYVFTETAMSYGLLSDPHKTGSYPEWRSCNNFFQAILIDSVTHFYSDGNSSQFSAALFGLLVNCYLERGHAGARYEFSLLTPVYTILYLLLFECDIRTCSILL